MDWDNIFTDKKSRLIFQVVVGGVLALISFIIFAKLVDSVFEQERLIFDATVIDYIYSFRNISNTKLMFFVSIFGLYGISALSVIIIILLILKKQSKLALHFLFMVGSGIVANAALKLFVQRQRPTYLPLALETDFSFPSGHTMGSFIFFIASIYIFYHLTRNKKFTLFFLVIAFVLTFLIGVSRIYLGVHYPSDILGGFIAGLLWFVGIITTDKIYTLRKLTKT